MNKPPQDRQASLLSPRRGLSARTMIHHRLPINCDLQMVQQILLLVGRAVADLVQERRRRRYMKRMYG